MTRTARSTAAARRAWRARRRRRAVAAVQRTAVRTWLAVLQRIAARAADRQVMRLWCTPPAGAAGRRDNRPGPGEIVRLDLPRGGHAVAEVWGQGPTVYLVHGWGGWRGQLGAFVGPLVASGYRVVAADAPGHGEASPSYRGPGQSTVMECVETLLAAGERFGPAAGIIGHSMGCLVTAHAIRAGLSADRLVLVAPPTAFGELAEQFGRALGLTERTKAAMIAGLKEMTGRDVADYDVAPLGADGSMPPTLVLHDRADRSAPFRVGEQVAATWPGARLVSSDGLGHQRILLDGATVANAVRHVAAQPTQDSSSQRAGIPVDARPMRSR